MENLWPEFRDTDEVDTPAVILKEQAKALGAQFKNKIAGEVIITRSGDKFQGIFMITSPPLSYNYKLFKIQYSLIDIYPVDVILEGDIAAELLKDEKEIIPFLEVVINADDETNFKDLLRRIFSTTKARGLIRALKQHISE